VSQPPLIFWINRRKWTNFNNFCIIKSIVVEQLTKRSRQISLLWWWHLRQTWYAGFLSLGTFQYGLPMSSTMLGSEQSRNRPEAATHMAASWTKCLSAAAAWKADELELRLLRRRTTKAPTINALETAITTKGTALTNVNANHGRTYTSKFCSPSSSSLLFVYQSRRYMQWLNTRNTSKMATN